MRAVHLYIKLGKRVRATILQLGYPTKASLSSWYREYERCLDLPQGLRALEAQVLACAAAAGRRALSQSWALHRWHHQGIGLSLPPYACNRNCPVNGHRRLCRGAWLPGALRTAPVDSLEQHRQLCRAQRDGTSVGLRPDESPLFKTLGQQAHAVAVTPKQLDQVAPPATEE
jgi:hypothetical protein